ncbi:MAG: PAS domain-containing sensor histidine kinase, partial [Caldimonas sp.]
FMSPDISGDEAPSTVTSPASVAVPADVGSAGSPLYLIERDGLDHLLPGLLWSADAGFGLRWANQGFIAYTGRALSELLGPGWIDCVHPEDRERGIGIFTTSQQAGLPFSMDLRLRRQDGEYRCMLVQAAPCGDCYGAVAVDIHERNRMEIELAEHTEARRRNDLRQGHFLASLSHELRGPLAPIANAASVLRTLEADNPTLLRLREILERQVARIRRVLDDLVDITQALQGELSMVRRPVSSNEVLELALAHSQPQFDARAQQVALKLPARPAMLEGDSVRLSQMVGCLLANASRYSPEGSTIDVDVGVDDERLRIGVKDTGRGIGASFLPHVFDLFAQETHEHKSGLGMGLTLARRIALHHGGTISARSAGPGLGSEFTVTLPLDARIEPRAAATKRTAARRATEIGADR